MTYNSKISEATVNNGVTTIGAQAFFNCYNLEKIDLGDCATLTSIGNYAFRNCYNLKEIDMGNCSSLTRIGGYAFFYCYGLAELDLSNCTELESIDTYTFYYCYGLTSIDLSNTKIEKLEKDVFALCTGLKEITLPSSLTEIESEVFYKCVKLESINLDECTQLTSIGYYAFYSCENLKNIKFPATLQQIHNEAFEYTALEEIDLSNCSDLSYIGTYAFFRRYDNYSENVNIYLPKNTTIEIGDSGLYRNRVDLGGYGTRSGIYYIDSSGIGYYYSSSDDTNYAYLAFVPSGLENIEIPSSITIDEIDYDITGMECFSLQYASDLEEITFEDSSIITYLDPYSFAYCENLTTVDGYSTSDKIMENVFYNVSTDYEYTLFECTNIDTTYNFIVWVDFDYYGYFTYEDEINDVSEITLELYCDGEVIEEVTLSKDEIDGSTYTFEDLEIGHEYYVDLKHNLDGWGANIRYYYAGDSTLTYEWISIERIYAYTVNIDWNDEESTGERPSEVEVILYDEDGNEYATAILNEENNWSYTFYVNTFSSAYTINYSYETVEYTVSVLAEDNVIESSIITYETNYDETTSITIYTSPQISSLSTGAQTTQTWGHKTATWACSVSRTTWSRSYEEVTGATISLTYTEITPLLESEIEKTGTEEITALTDEVTYNIIYSATIDDYKGDVSLILIDTLPFTIDEEQSDLDGGTYNSEDKTITWEEEIETVNTFETDEALEIEITKTITVVYTDIDLTQESFENDVQATITLLNASSSSSSEATQTVEDDSETKINITTDISVSKEWEDEDNQDGKRPESVEVQLYANEESLGEDYLITLNEENGWTYTWDNLAVYGNGEEISYTVQEATDLTELGYIAEISGSATDGYIITNSYEPETRNISVTKVWEDSDNQDGKRLESVEVQLYADGESLGEDYLITLSEENSWTYTWEDLDTYKDGEEIAYTVQEITDLTELGYIAEISGSATDGYTITNSYEPETRNISVTKVWEDSDNQDGKRLKSIDVQLYADGESLGEDYLITLSEENSWTYTWEDLDTYKDGEEIAYTVQEITDLTELGYIADITGSAVEGYTITNNYEPETRNISVTKVWEDSDNQDGKRLESIDVQLYANGESLGEKYLVTLSEENSWTYTWENLETYKDGEEIVYTVQEITDLTELGYIAEITGSAVEGYIITNNYKPETRSISVTKVWEDYDNKCETRPKRVDVQLYADGESLGGGYLITLSEENSWTYTWENLYTYKDGKEIAYTVMEVTDMSSLGYDEPVISGSASEGYTITNSISTVSITITKISSTDSSVLEGVEFSLYIQVCSDNHDSDLIDTQDCDDDCWELIGTYTSGSDGTFTLSNLPIAGTYRLVETKTLEDYLLPEGQWEIEFEYDDNLDDDEKITMEIVTLQITPISSPPSLSSIDGVLYLSNEEKDFDLPYTGILENDYYTKAGVVITLIGIIILLISRKKVINPKKIGSLRGSVTDARRIIDNWDKKK